MKLILAEADGTPIIEWNLAEYLTCDHNGKVTGVRLSAVEKAIRKYCKEQPVDSE